MSRLLCNICLLVCAASVFKQTATMPVKDDKGAMKFLNRFGYISDKEMAKGNLSMADSDVQTVLKLFQKYSGLKETGMFNSETMQMMNRPRCGNKDMSVMRAMKKIRKKRYAVHSSWSKKVLTYQVLNYPKCCITPATVELEVALAFKMWQKEIPASNLRIRKRKHGSKDAKADIEIKFTVDPHEDNLDFGDMQDKSGRSVAHAFYPLQDDPDDPIRGDIHFNNKENWTSGIEEGQGFLQTVAHEIGHALGLEHSLNDEAVMFARVLPFDPRFKLHSDDKLGIKALYDHGNAINGRTGISEVPPGRGTAGEIDPSTQFHPTFSIPGETINHKRNGWHCQKLLHHVGQTVMIAEQCVGDPEKTEPEQDSIDRTRADVFKRNAKVGRWPKYNF